MSKFFTSIATAINPASKTIGAVTLVCFVFGFISKSLNWLIYLALWTAGLWFVWHTYFPRIIIYIGNGEQKRTSLYEKARCKGLYTAFFSYWFLMLLYLFLRATVSPW